MKMIDSALKPKGTAGLSPGETLQQFLENAFCELPHLDGVFLFTPQGESLARATDETVNDAGLSSLMENMLRLGQRLASELQRGKFNYLAMQCQRGPIVATRLDQGHTLVLLGRHDVRLGLVLYDLESLATRLGPALG
jgi:predicted regulator of Ras-like GTPase activity (Roadblock/LC7/MglB family)